MRIKVDNKIAYFDYTDLESFKKQIFKMTKKRRPEKIKVYMLGSIDEEVDLLEDLDKDSEKIFKFVEDPKNRMSIGRDPLFKPFLTKNNENEFYYPSFGMVIFE